jgi:hypothetical protein
VGELLRSDIYKPREREIKGDRSVAIDRYSIDASESAEINIGQEADRRERESKRERADERKEEQQVDQGV